MIKTPEHTEDLTGQQGIRIIVGRKSGGSRVLFFTLVGL